MAEGCMPGTGDDSSSTDKVLKDNILSETAFNQRMDRLKEPFCQSSPDTYSSPAKPRVRALSNVVSGIQQKLQGDATPSSQQFSRIRQEREQELNQLPFQPISENAWLKRSSSDPLLFQGRTPGLSSPSSGVPRAKRVVQWPPMQQWHVDDNGRMNNGSYIEADTSGARNGSLTDVEVSSLDETNTAEIIDQMFEEVLEYAERKDKKQCNEEDTGDQDSGISNCCGEKERVESEKSREYLDDKDKECEKFESNGDELLTFPPDGILSPLSKFVEAVVTPLKRKRQASDMDACPESLVLTPKETPRFPVETAPLYSIDAYRTQRQSKVLATPCVTPGIQRGVPENPQPQSSTNIKEKILGLNEEAAKLQTVIKQTLQALSCCTDVEHGRGSLEEAEAEKLLLVSCEKCSALQAEVVRLREEKSSDSKGEETDRQQPCRGTVSITNIQLPLKLEYVCSSHNSSGRPSYYFFILIRYGPCNIVSTPLATAADAQNGDTISFSTSVTLEDIRSTFEIDVEAYSLSQTSGTNSGIDHSITRSRVCDIFYYYYACLYFLKHFLHALHLQVTPKKLLNTLTHRTSNNLASPAFPTLGTRRSSNFCLVGSHKITLASLGHNKFLLDKMKLEGKIRRLLGDEFQEKVPFLSPLEGHIYLQLDSESHSCVQNQGFLTMFEVISGYGAWHRRYFILDGCTMLYWNHPNDKESKEAEGVISLSSSPNQCVRPVNRDSCARPYTFELVSNILQQDDNNGAFAKCWFSADTKQEKLNWIEKLSQALLDFHTWNRSSEIHTEMQQSNNSSGNLRESIL
ncbi:LOW QUALITY PROTEIN: anillin, actin binding protein 2 [Phycodurus eques]|uniref:LOW QUALITY PROTEIN: anillin, actin binding protein 2 n=1 Tax=Phycodurus eques TaxID=693459 RepID=UPI002ACE11A7|nr:LOW QUALITY PROTEIN: anillin, actin binding protein 2 [Phycodurus eques]